MNEASLMAAYGGLSSRPAMTGRRPTALPALAEWEAVELARARARGMSVGALAVRYGISVRTVQRYLRARFVCVHCRVEFRTARAAFDHLFIDEEA